MRTTTPPDSGDTVASTDNVLAVHVDDEGKDQGDVTGDGLARARVVPTRAGRAWVRLLPALIVVSAGLVFILQNRGDAHVRFFTLSGSLPLAVALFAAFAFGVASTLLLGSIRILQLRKAVRRGRARR